MSNPQIISKSILGSNLWSVIQVVPGDSRIGDGTDYGIGFTLEELITIIWQVKTWSLNVFVIGTVWYNETNDVYHQKLPNYPNIPNNNVWSADNTHEAGQLCLSLG